MEEKTFLFITRHGTVNTPKPGMWGGQIDYHLSDSGKKQAEILGKVLTKFGISVIITSTLSRSVDTGRIVQKHIPGSVLESHDELIEMSHGEVDGLTTEEFFLKFPNIPQAWGRNEDPVFPGGENFEMVEKRAIPKLNQLLSKYKGKKLLFVGHKSINLVLLGHFLKIPFAYRHILEQENCHLTLIQLSPKQRIHFVNVYPEGIKHNKVIRELD